MEGDPETVAEVIGDHVANTIEATIENAEAQAEHAAEVNELLTEAALEGERGRRIGEVERRLDEWQSERMDTAEAIAALTLGMTALTAKVDLLAQQSTPVPPPMQVPPSEGDGPRENHAEIVEEVKEAVAETPAPPPPAPKKKKRSWI